MVVRELSAEDRWLEGLDGSEPVSHRVELRLVVDLGVLAPPWVGDGQRVVDDVVGAAAAVDPRVWDELLGSGALSLLFREGRVRSVAGVLVEIG